MALSPELEKLVDDYNQRRDKSRDHWKKDPITGGTYNVPIKFYLGNKYLGIGYVPEGSMREHRRAAAKKLGIYFYNGIVFNMNRDMRNVRITGQSGKKYRAIDFIPDFDRPIYRNYMMGMNPESNRMRKLKRKAFLKQFPLTAEEVFKSQ